MTGLHLSGTVGTDAIDALRLRARLADTLALEAATHELVPGLTRVAHPPLRERLLLMERHMTVN